MRIRDVTMGVTSIDVGPMICGTDDLLCPPVLEWGSIAPMLQHDA